MRSSSAFSLSQLGEAVRPRRLGGGALGHRRMCEPCPPDALLEAVRGLRVAEPDLGFKPLLAKLREQQPDLGAATKEVREALAALAALKAESEAAKATAAAPPAADQGRAPSPAALSLACIGCLRLPSDMDDEREKHPICSMCHYEKMPTTYLCGKDCRVQSLFEPNTANRRQGLPGEPWRVEAARGVSQEGEEAAEGVGKARGTIRRMTRAERPGLSARPSP